VALGMACLCSTLKHTLALSHTLSPSFCLSFELFPSMVPLDAFKESYFGVLFVWEPHWLSVASMRLKASPLCQSAALCQRICRCKKNAFINEIAEIGGYVCALGNYYFQKVFLKIIFLQSFLKYQCIKM